MILNQRMKRKNVLNQINAFFLFLLNEKIHHLNKDNLKNTIARSSNLLLTNRKSKNKQHIKFGIFSFFLIANKKKREREKNMM
jgi:hypothetical protein